MTLRDWHRPSIGHACLQTLGVGVLLWVFCAGAAAQELTPWTGGPTPPLTLTDQRGTNHTLAAYRNRVVLINFWATWCEPCREEMPALQALQNTIGKERLVVLTVNYGESAEKVQKFAQTVSLDMPILLDRHMETAKAWQVRILPTSFVLGPDGQIRYSAVGLLDWGEAQVVKRIAALAAQP